jgi:hypothetical protein
MSKAEAMRYYGLDWPAGPLTAAAHVFSGLDPRPFLIDQHDFGARYERWLQALTVALLILAGVGVGDVWHALRHGGWRRRPEAVFLGAVAFLATGILAA